MPKTRQQLKQEILEVKKKIQSTDSDRRIEKLQIKLGELAEKWDEVTGGEPLPRLNQGTGFGLPPAMSTEQNQDNNGPGLPPAGF
jgi:hypothetical protein